MKETEGGLGGTGLAALPAAPACLLKGGQDLVQHLLLVKIPQMLVFLLPISTTFIGWVTGQSRPSVV